MGVVMRQGIKSSLITYVFMGVSILASLYIFPRDVDLYGTLGFFIDTANLLIPILLLGTGFISVKFYPEVKAKFGSGHPLIGMAFVVSFISISLIAVVGFIFRDRLVENFSDKSTLIDIGQWLWIFIPLILLLGIQTFVSIYISNFRLVAFPKLVQSLIRISLPIAFVLAFMGWIPVSWCLYFFLIHYLITILILVVYLNRTESIRLPKKSSVIELLQRRDIQIYGAFAVLTTIGSNLAFRLDSFMVTTLIDTSNNGVYLIGNRIGSIIAVPTAAIMSISAPILSSAMKEGDLKQTGDLYRRSSEVLTIAGVFMLAGLAVIVTDIFHIMPDGDQLVRSGAIHVVGLIAMARFVDMATSVNAHIIVLSKYFRYNLYFLLFLALSNVGLNLVLIPNFGLVGAAYATFSSLLLYNLIKLIFIKWKLGLWPFTFKTILIIGIGIISSYVVQAFPFLDGRSDWLNIVIKGGAVSLLIFCCLYFFGISAEFNHAVNVARRRIVNFIK